MFNNKCYIKRNDNFPSNFDSRVDESIFHSYSIKRKRYKCYNKRTKRIEDYVDVIFDEELHHLEIFKENEKLDEKKNPILKYVECEEEENNKKEINKKKKK